MKILSRYIIWEHIPPFFFSITVLMFIFLMQFLIKYITHIFGKGLSIIYIFELLFYNLAWMFALAVPMAVLVATLMSFGRLSGDNEITILKSSGVSIYRIIRPALLFAFIITVLMILFNDKVLPDYNHKARAMFSSIRKKKPTLKLEPGIFFNLGNYSFQVEKIEKTFGEEISERTNILGPEYDTETNPDKLVNVTIFQRVSSTKTITVTAEEGYMIYSNQRKSLVFTLFNGEHHHFDDLEEEKYRFSHFSRTVVTMDAPDFELEEREDNYRGDREMNVSMMMERVDENQQQIENEKSRVIKAIGKHWQPILSKISRTKNSRSEELELYDLSETITRNTWESANNKSYRRISRLYQTLRSANTRISSNKQTINKFLVEVYKKFSIPFASLVFILVGAPLGIAARKGSLGVGITLSIIFFLIYWACLIAGEDFADRRLLTPFWAMWFPNILLGLAGAYLTWRTVKEVTIFKWDKILAYFKRTKQIRRY